MLVQIYSNKKKTLDKALIVMATITIIMALLIITIIVLNHTKVQFFKQKGNEIKESYLATENKTWDISENRDGSVAATLTEDGTLIISGAGKMKEWAGFEKTEWREMKDKVKTVIIEEGVTNIGDCVFQGNTHLTSIEIPNTVTSIGAFAFMGCTSLTIIEIPDSVTNIGKYAFEGCTGIISIEMPNGVTNIDDGQFMGCTSLKRIKMSNTLKSIGYNAFYKCISLTNIKIPNTVTNIGELAFGRCTGLTNIEISNSVISINYRAFEGCTNLTSIDVDRDNKNYMDYNGVLYTKDESKIIRYPEGKKETKYTILSGVISIERGAFYGCTVLNSIEIPNSVTTIETDAFVGCTGLTSMEIPNSVTNIEGNAFLRCTSLAKIVIPNSGTDFGICVFLGCQNLTIYCTSSSNARQYAITNNIKYLIDDKAPTITSIVGNSTEWTNKNVTLTINAEDVGVGLAKEPYSFDGGKTWQAENTKTYTNNSSGIVIKVKDKLNNIYTHEAIDGVKIDKQVPQIGMVTGNATKWTNKNVTLTIIAKDSASGLAAKPYSFDGGKTWQAENTKTYTSNSASIVIKVKDKAGNINTYNQKIVVKYIDKKAPTINVITNTTQQGNLKKVTLTIVALDSLSGLADKPYSFDGGKTWQAENTKTYTKIPVGTEIKVKDKAGNIVTYSIINKLHKLELY